LRIGVRVFFDARVDEQRVAALSGSSRVGRRGSADDTDRKRGVFFNQQ